MKNQISNIKTVESPRADLLNFALCILIFALSLPTAALQAADAGFVPLFNGKDFDGWVNVNCAPETWTVRDGTIICTGIPTGVLRTEKQYENYILELEWRHINKGGNAGLFIHSDPITAAGQPFTRSINGCGWMSFVL